MTISQSEQHGADPVRAEVMRAAQAVAGDPPRPQLRSIVCPYCGSVSPDSGRCGQCAGRFDPLSRQATQNQMGPWEIRDARVPFRPGCSYATLARLVEQGVISAETVLRGPSTRQFWMLARHTPGVSHLFGVCHNCQGEVRSDAFSCPACEASFEVVRDRQHMGLGPSRPLPGQGLPEVLALHAEPASVGVGREIASTSIGSPSGSGGAAQIRSVDGAGGSDDESRRRLEDANRLVRQWPERATLDRQHAWMVMIVACLITISALGYLYWSGTGASSADSGAESGSEAGLMPE